jgi:hypothetical protein
MDDKGYGMHELTPVLPVKDVLATVAYYRDVPGLEDELFRR